MNLILNNIMLLTNSQSPQEKLDNNHNELKKFLKKTMLMMLSYNLNNHQSKMLQ